ncbi:MAG: hypothetical protein HC804_05835 [Anaerolineae bacterium]|nr:hypothetical protein [Anaerolineae bacterium]
MKEFVFGSLSTIEQRVAHLRTWRQGIKHHNRLTPRAPRADDQPILTVTVQQDRPIARVECEVVEPVTEQSGLGTAVFCLQMCAYRMGFAELVIYRDVANHLTRPT